MGVVGTLAIARVDGPLLDDGVYVNFLSCESRDRVRAAYGENDARLADCKREWDPENLFRANQTVEPAG